MNIEHFKNLPVYSISPENVEYVEIALVDNPAIEIDFLTFNDEKETKYLFNNDLMELKGPVLIPNKLIYRNLPTERYVTFTEENIKKSVEMFMKNGLKFNESHTDKKINISILESYFASEENEFNVPKGSWIISAKVNDIKLWEEIKNKKFNGFSFEGLFSNEFIREENFNKNNKNKMNIKEKIMNAINSIVFEEDVDVKNDDVLTDKTIVDKFVYTPVVDDVQPIVDTDKTDVLTEEKVNEIIEEKLNSFMEKILVLIDEKINGVNSEVEKMHSEIEKFGNQPLTETYTQIIEKTNYDSDFSYLKNINK